MSTEIKSANEVEGIRVASQLAAETLLLVGEKIRAGMTTEEINQIVHDDTLKRGAIPAPLNYGGNAERRPFPKSVCTSVNDVVCHGIPNTKVVLKPGDIVNVDVTSKFGGFFGDTSATFYIGPPSKEAKHVVETARRALELGIAEVREGARLGDIGAAIQEFVESEGCSVVRDFVGHGIGRKFHEPPQVKHYGTRGVGARLKAGMVFTIEPMVNLGKYEVDIDEDDHWTVRTADGLLSAQFEHTVCVTKTGVDVLTRRVRALRMSEEFPSITA